MRKEEIASLIVYLLMIAIAVIVGLSVVTNAMSVCRPTNFNSFAFVVLTILVAIILNVVMLEVLHVIGGKLGGYAIVSVNILGFHFERKDKKLTLRIRDFDGLTGETKLAPKKEKLNLKPYIWLPLFGYAAELAGGIVLYSNMMGNSKSDVRWLGVCAILFVIISSMIALYNLVPIKLDSMTDGYRFVLISKPANIEAYNELLRVEDLERRGEPVNGIKVFDDITEFTANLNLVSVYKHLDEGKYEEAEKILDLMLKEEKKLEPNTFNRMIAHKIFISIMTKDVEEARTLYNEITNDKIRRFIANDLSMESVRAYLLISGVLEKSRGEFNYAINKKDKALKRSSKQRAIIEEKLYSLGLNKVYEAHPNWKDEQKENVAD